MADFGGYGRRDDGEALRKLRRYLDKKGPAENFLASARAERRLTQYALAARMGFAQSVVASVESGARKMSAGFAGAAAKALKVPRGTLLASAKLAALKSDLAEDPDGRLPRSAQILETLLLIEEALPESETKQRLRELLAEALNEAVARDRARLKSLEEREAVEGKARGQKAALKSRREQLSKPTRDVFGRRLRDEGSREVSLKSGEATEDEPRRDGFGRRRNKVYGDGR